MTVSDTTKRGKPRQRATVACERCHTRRIKCVPLFSNPTCEACQKTSSTCTPISSKRLGKRKKVSVSPTSQDWNHPPPKEPNHDQQCPYVSNGESAEASEPIIRDIDQPLELALNGQSSSTSGLLDETPAESLYAQVLDGAALVTNTERIMGGVPGSQRQVVYLGETFNLTHLVLIAHPDWTASSARHHHALPHSQQSPYTTLHVSSELHSTLRGQGAFSLPPLGCIHDLFRSYFSYFHPHYPVLDRGEFAKRYRLLEGCPPPSYLLLHSVLFAGAGHCDDSTISAIGLGDRLACRRTLFQRAKALYDADYEQDKATLVQATFLMSFWWEKPADQKDTWHWLGVSISLAVTIGMHRDTSDSGMSVRDQHLWKRIWWSLFVEDKHAAAALGRPIHVRSRDCDVKPLEFSDFEDLAFIEETDVMVFGQEAKIHVAYTICLSELSKIVEHIIEASFNAQKETIQVRSSKLTAIQDQMEEWKRKLPPELVPGQHSEELWPHALHSAYSWFQILMYRSLDPLSSTRATGRAPLPAVDAANSIGRHVEHLLSAGRIRHSPIHLIPSIFASMGIHAIDVIYENGNHTWAELGQVKMRLCLVALRQIKPAWPVAGWIEVLFTRFLEQRTERRRNPSAARDMVDNDQNQHISRALFSSAKERPNTPTEPPQPESLSGQDSFSTYPNPFDQFDHNPQPYPDLNVLLTSTPGSFDWAAQPSMPVHYPAEWNDPFPFSIDPFILGEHYESLDQT